ncbi:MAG: carboxypeptidase regulatory-like domain-containing protein [Myxococcales bacterium]|nr:carboxypeptidase regulatory-like domain-containing protein [Myxococcales bacterium]
MVWKLLNGRAVLPYLAALVALLVALPSWAQTTGQLRITVVDTEMQLEIPQVTLRLEGENLIGGVQERQTNALGQFLFTELPPGNYNLEASKGGFGGVTVRDIRINISRTTPLTVELSTQQGEEVVVKATRDAVDTESTSRSQILTKEFLEKIPAGRSYQTAVTFAAGVTDNGTGNPNMGGGAFNENTYMLDGVNITDPVTGTFSLNFNFDAIQQIEVLLGGYMPEYGTSLGGIINLVTRSGNNNLEYQARIFYNNGNVRPRMDERVTADGFTLAPTGFDATFQSYSVAALLSGPIVRDKAWFILSYSANRSIIANTGIAQARDFDAHYLLAKLTVQPSTEHRISAQLQTDPTNIANRLQGNPFVRAEAQRQQVQGGYVASLRWQWFLSPETTLDTVGSVQKSYLEGSGVPCTHNRDRAWNPCEPGEREDTVDWQTPGRIGIGGGAYDSVNDIRFDFDDRFTYRLSTKLSLLSVNDPLGGSHDLKFGAEGAQLVWDRIVGINGNQYFLDLNEVPFDPSSFINRGWWEITAPIKFRTTSSQYNVFAQDSWKPVSNLTINYGSRFDSFVIRNDLGEPVLSGGLLGPRLYASWDPFKKQKTKIATGYGRFNDIGRLGVANFTSLSSFGSKLYFGEQLSTLTAGEGFLNSQADIWVANPRQNLNTAHDNLRNPRVDEIILILEQEVIEDLALFSQMSGKFSRFLFEPDDVNLVYDEDGSSIIGSRLADPLNLYGRLRTPALAKRDYYQWDLGLRKVESRRWAAEASYSYINALGSSSQSLSGSFLVDPQTQYNYGNLNTDRRHQFKSLAYWNLPTDPWTQSLSLAFVYYDGFPFERLYYSDTFGGYGLRIRPRGTYYRFNPYWFLSLGFRQEIDVRKGKFILSVDAQNITNNRAPDRVSGGFIFQENRLLTISRQDPLRLQIGAGYEF